MSCCRFPFFLILLALTSFAVPHAGNAQSARDLGFTSTDWPWWRGPDRNGVADPNQQPPLQWGDTENILWKSPLPGRGHGSPTIVDDRIYLAVGDDDPERQLVLSLDRDSGEIVWEVVVHRGGMMKKNEKASLASSSVACDGELLFINFFNDGAVYTTALTLDGKIQWQAKVSDYVLHQGYGSSPAIYGELVIVSADNKGGGAIVALDRGSGMERWRVDRPEEPNYPSPIILNVAGRDQLLMTGCDLVTGIDPLSGEKLWEVEGATTECVTSTVTDGELIYTSGGFPRNHLAAVRADGSGELVWETGDRIYVPSMLVQEGYLYAVLDAGVAACWDAATGEPQWKARLGGNFTASPVLVGDQIYAMDEDATTTIFRATPDGFERLGKNELADDAFATPTIVGGRIYARVGVRDGGQRRELLVCIGH